MRRPCWNVRSDNFIDAKPTNDRGNDSGAATRRARRRSGRAGSACAGVVTRASTDSLVFARRCSRSVPEQEPHQSMRDQAVASARADWFVAEESENDTAKPPPPAAQQHRPLPPMARHEDSAAWKHAVAVTGSN